MNQEHQGEGMMPTEVIDTGNMKRKSRSRSCPGTRCGKSTLLSKPLSAFRKKLSRDTQRGMDLEHSNV